MSINGERVALLDIDSEMTRDRQERPEPRRRRSTSSRPAARRRRVHPAVRRRRSTICVAPIDHTLADTESAISFGITTLPHMRDFSITGPSTVDRRVRHAEPPQGLHLPPDSRGRREPVRAPDLSRPRGARLPPPARRDEDVDALMQFYGDGRKGGDFEAGITHGAAGDPGEPAVRVPPRAGSRRTWPPGADYRISDLELASRLSFFLWSTLPDAELLDAARERHAARAGVLEKQVRRMLADPRADALVDALRGAVAAAAGRRDDARPIRCSSRTYDSDARAVVCAARRSCSSTASCARTRSVLDLLTADYTFVNERLASALQHPERARQPSSGAWSSRTSTGAACSARAAS